LEITTLLIPEQNDSEAEISALSEWVVSNLGPLTPLHFTAFHPDFKMLDSPHTPATTLQRARACAQAAGLKHVYTGNIHDPAGQSTYCATCGTRIIERDGYTIGQFQLDASGDDSRATCRQCGAQVEGHFDPTPGQFGPQRHRLRLL
jgi:pyruvate formate lyase activating enzyme